MTMRYRRLIGFTPGGTADPEIWQAAVGQEPPVGDKPKACDGCPLRIGGEWEPGAAKALEAMEPAERSKMCGWGCHVADQPCAGMLRLVKASEAGQQ